MSCKKYFVLAHCFSASSFLALLSRRHSPTHTSPKASLAHFTPHHDWTHTTPAFPRLQPPPPTLAPSACQHNHPPHKLPETTTHCFCVFYPALDIWHDLFKSIPPAPLRSHQIFAVPPISRSEFQTQIYKCRGSTLVQLLTQAQTKDLQIGSSMQSGALNKQILIKLKLPFPQLIVFGLCLHNPPRPGFFIQLLKACTPTLST